MWLLKSLFINDVKTTPYYDAASGTYMALVKPEAEYSISCTYQGTQEKMINPTGSLAGGKAKMYTIKDKNNKIWITPYRLVITFVPMVIW